MSRNATPGQVYSSIYSTSHDEQPEQMERTKKSTNEFLERTTNGMKLIAPEIVPAILKRTYEGIFDQWKIIYKTAPHVQIDITDGIFAGDGTFRDVRLFKRLPISEKIELHMMVHTPESYVNDILDLNPARCIFHIEAFEGKSSIDTVYRRISENSQTQMALAINPDSSAEWLEEYLDVIDYVLFMGYNPGWADQAIDVRVFNRIVQFHDRHPEVTIAVDGHVNKDTIKKYVEAGASILAANSSVFREGDAPENLRQLQLLAEAAFEA